LAAFKYSTAIIEKHGTLVVVGQPKEDIPFHYSTIIFQDLTIVAGCLGQKAIVQAMVDMVQREGIHVETNAYTLDTMDKLIKDYHDPNTKGKLVVII
jgi:D-arabinose 1-dehydrogenase-like Zn-dependent alcohol dehydrogenase